VCFFADIFDDPDLYDIGPCDGPVDMCHLIPKQRIRRELAGAPALLVEEAVWHPAILVEGCRFHHGQYDHYQIRIPASLMPASVFLYARVMGLEACLDRDYR